MLIVVMSEGVVCSVCNYISELRSRLDKAGHHHKVTIKHYTTNSEPGIDRVHFMLLAKNLINWQYFFVCMYSKHDYSR